MEEREDIEVKFFVNIRKFSSDNIQDSKYNMATKNILKNGKNSAKSEPVRNVEGDEELVETVLHIWWAKNSYVNNISSHTKKSNSNGCNTNDEWKLRNGGFYNVSFWYPN